MNPLPTSTETSSAPPSGPRAWLRQGENLLLSSVLVALMVLPLLEAFLRKAFSTGVPGATALVQHFTLIIAMLGGALAARDSRLLAMSALPAILPEKGKLFAALFSGTVATTVALFLTLAGVEFVKTERESGNILVGTMPIWWIQTITPIGFALVTWRLLRNASPKWWGRAVVLVASGLLVWLATHPPTDPAKLVWPAIATLLAATVLGAPIFVTLGGAAMILF